MTIDVKGEGSGGMAEIFLNGLHVVTVLQRGNSEAMPQIVKPHFGNTDLFSDPFELLVQRLVEDGLADLIGKDEIVRVVPELTGFCLRLQLMLAVLFQHMNAGFRMSNAGTRVNYPEERGLAGSSYIKTKGHYQANELRNYVLNFYDKYDRTEYLRRREFPIAPDDWELARNVLRLEVQCGYVFIKELCEKLLGKQQKALEVLERSAEHHRIMDVKYAYGQKQIQKAGIYPFAEEGEWGGGTGDPLKLILRRLAIIGAVEESA